MPIRKLEDFKNVKIRSHSGYDPLFKKVGAIPIGMNISEIYGALERGVVAAAPYPIFVYDMGCAGGHEIRSGRCLLAVAHDLHLHQSEEVQRPDPEAAGRS